MTLSTILESVGEFVTSALSWVVGVTQTIVAQPLLLMFVIVSMVGLAVGLIRRIINL